MTLARSRRKESPESAWSWVWKPGLSTGCAQPVPVLVLCLGSRGPEQGVGSTGHRHPVISPRMAGTKQAGGRFAFSRRVGVP